LRPVSRLLYAVYEKIAKTGEIGKIGKKYFNIQNIKI
jgi:hypothetical protein